MRHPVHYTHVLLVAAVLFVGGCDSETPTGPTDPAPTVTDTFSGTLAVNGAATHPFTTQAAGTVTATLTNLEPGDTAVIGFSLGTWNGTVCQAVLANDAATRAAVFTATVQTASSLCVRVYDPNAIIVGTVTYTIQVVHP